MALESVALLLGILNGFFLVVRPVGRIHSRIDALEHQTQMITASLARIEKRLEYEIERLGG